MASHASLRYTIVITGPAYGTQQSSCAYQFIHTLLTQTPHTIHTIFFYEDGVYNANDFIRPANDEFNLVQAWQNLASQFNLSLVTCASAALRRGVIQDEKHNNLTDHFQVSGLTALSAAIANSDRVIQF
ncbi:sulfurtransferase complex subunit TusD [Zophobihabitans entericus]|uniref:Sulfurtransferase complex subunit TusD n=1 Tax=Zophobihabitans entericus TaxID=1635327 RepID=A0A6G9I9D8_9GAMM|nr:sulfurtransferase complex subunit TusD [Zophobihabitans entericus]QIQ20467.1 sulfurtransferase complex subunit TusD [Zophobihabitans entericus]